MIKVTVEHRRKRNQLSCCGTGGRIFPLTFPTMAGRRADSEAQGFQKCVKPNNRVAPVEPTMQCQATMVYTNTHYYGQYETVVRHTKSASFVSWYSLTRHQDNSLVDRPDLPVKTHLTAIPERLDRLYAGNLGYVTNKDDVWRPSTRTKRIVSDLLYFL